jgi:transglutaminase superfamily protein
MSVLLRRLRTWTWRDHATVCETMVCALVVEVAIRVMPMSTVLASLQRRSRSRTTVHALDVDRLARFAAAPYRVLSRGGTCLRESLVLCALLARRGIDARVCFGVDRQGGDLTAHAWVEIAGVRSEPATGYHELRGAWSA